MFKRWQFWTVMTGITAITLLLAIGFKLNPRLVQSPLVKKEAPQWEVTTFNTGETLSLAALKGTPVVLNFWASWCEACKTEAHVLEAAHRKWGGDPKKFRVIGIAIQDKEEAARKFARRFGKTYSLALDNPAGDIALNYGLYGVPETFFIDRDGIIAYKQIGAVTQALMEEWVPQMLEP